MKNRHKVAVFADRLKRVTDAYKADVEAIIEDAKKVEVDPSGLRRLVSWMSRDVAARTQQELIDEQYRFLAGEIEEAPAEPTEGELAVAIALYREKATVRQVAESLKISVGKAHKLKVVANAFTVHGDVNSVNSEQPSAEDEADAAMMESKAKLDAMKREKGFAV